MIELQSFINSASILLLMFLAGLVFWYAVTSFCGVSDAMREEMQSFKARREEDRRRAKIVADWQAQQLRERQPAIGYIEDPMPGIRGIHIEGDDEK